MPLRVAIDANILLAAIVWPRWPYAVLMHALEGDFVLVLSPLVVAEARHHLARRFAEYLPQFDLLLAQLEFEMAPVPSPAEVEAHAHLMRDPNDIPVALSIWAANVDYFVTYDKDFTDSGETTRAVQAVIPGIILPPVFLRDVMGWTSEELAAIRTRNWTDMEAP